MTTSKTAQQVRDWLGYLTQAELAYLKRVSSSAKKGAKFVNIGAGGGTSGTAFMESNPDIQVTTIDPQLESSPFGCLEGETVVLEAAGLIPSDRYSQIHGRSQDIAKSWSGGKVDVVFVDGGHEYQEVVDDIEGWMSHIKAGGLMILHDYNKVGWHRALHPETKDLSDEEVAKLAKAKPGVDQAVRELLLGKYVKEEEFDTVIAFRNRRVTGAKKTVAKPASNPATKKTTTKKTSTTKKS